MNGRVIEVFTFQKGRKKYSDIYDHVKPPFQEASAVIRLSEAGKDVRIFASKPKEKGIYVEYQFLRCEK
jgi:hypothetical protein